MVKVVFAARSESNEIDLGPEALADLEAKLPGLSAHADVDNPGMHATETVDVGVVHSGEVWCEFDTGKEVRLVAGDYIIQNGTNHRWENRSDAPCEMTFLMIGATRHSSL